MAAKPSSQLLQLPLVILHIVVEDLYETDQNAYSNFRLVSRTCRNRSEYLLFRNITIDDRTAVSQSQSTKILEKLKDSNGVTGEYIRHLKIGPFKDEDRFEIEISPMLVGILKNAHSLQDLTWSMNCAPLPVMLDSFHEWHPSAHLHMILRNRKFNPLSRDILSSPQLYTLDTEVYRIMPDDTERSLSELSLIKNSIAPSLQVLRLSSRGVHAYPQRAQFEGWEIIKHSTFNFDFQPGDRFPALLELALEDDEFILSEENCDLWARATSWERLERLDLYRGAPRHFFASLTNRSTNLKYLRFYINSPTSNRTWDLHPLETGLLVLAKFFASTASLHTLDFGVQDLDVLARTLRVILQNLHGSLRNLTITSSGGGNYSGPIDFIPGMLAWDLEHYMEVLELAPGLEHLDARIGEDAVVGDWKGRECYADSGKKWKTAEKKIKSKPKEKKQRSKKAQKLVW
ncbi:hypothetical protein A1F99_083580 [Pyrenophora tritici-repentis]|nr:hypothetical protein A1F99_083580 [Pyrenophora tritici-repentis]